MNICIKWAVLGLVLTGPVNSSLAVSKSPKLAHCDGKHRRPANVHGSILPTVDPASGTVVPATAPQNAIDVFPQTTPAKPGRDSHDKRRRDDEPKVQVPPISAATPPRTYASC